MNDVLHRPATPSRELLLEAVAHIRKTAAQSRSQSRRDRWIVARADMALAGKPFSLEDCDIPLKSAASVEARSLRLRLRVKELSSALVEAQPFIEAHSQSRELPIRERNRATALLEKIERLLGQLQEPAL